MSGADELSVSPGEKASEKPLSSYEIFLLALVAYSTLNLILLILPLHTYQTRVVLIMDAIVGILFFFDFLYRLIRVPDRTDYFFRQAGWLDLIAGLPRPVFDWQNWFDCIQRSKAGGIRGCSGGCTARAATGPRWLC